MTSWLTFVSVCQKTYELAVKPLSEWGWAENGTGMRGGSLRVQQR